MISKRKKGSDYASHWLGRPKQETPHPNERKGGGGRKSRGFFDLVTKTENEIVKGKIKSQSRSEGLKKSQRGGNLGKQR